MYGAILDKTLILAHAFPHIFRIWYHLQILNRQSVAIPSNLEKWS